ncbi:hypothetical protein IFM89_017444 [Coptis chinensis]|uniref:Uncharacterized protein n=1 Tax=Coptis chinensis TaxID=261450 RepID=A0A835LFJ1_9MAGN|nr:hypothetical protein IFM89_017444 [Coptis chinensis]
MLPQRLQQRLGPRSGTISTQSGPSILPRRLQGRLGPGSGPQDPSHNAHPSDEETLMSMLLKGDRKTIDLGEMTTKSPREENSQQESSVPKDSRSQKMRYHPRSHASSNTQNHRTPIVERLGGANAILGRVRSPQCHRSRSVSRRSQYPKEQSMSVSGYSSAAQINLERDVQRSRSPVLQRGQHRPARGNRRFDRSPGGSESSESGHNGSRNTHRRTNGGYQRAGDRRGSQHWARSHRMGALHNSVGGYAQTRELNPRRAEVNFRQHRQDSVEPGWSPERRNHTYRVGTNNVALQENSDSLNEQRHDKDRKKHNKDAKTGVSQSQKQDGRPSKDLTLPELSVSLSELYDKLKGKLSKPFPMKPDTEGRRDKSKKCKYHNDFGHTLNDCYAFKKEVSRMADGGQLKEYLKGTQKDGSCKSDRNRDVIVSMSCSKAVAHPTVKENGASRIRFKKLVVGIT